MVFRAAWEGCFRVEIRFSGPRRLRPEHRLHRPHINLALGEQKKRKQLSHLREESVPPLSVLDLVHWFMGSPGLTGVSPGRLRACGRELPKARGRRFWDPGLPRLISSPCCPTHSAKDHVSPAPTIWVASYPLYSLLPNLASSPSSFPQMSRHPKDIWGNPLQTPASPPLPTGHSSCPPCNS